MKKTKLSKVVLLSAIYFLVNTVLAQPSTTPAWTAFYNNTLVTANDDYGRAVTTDGGGNVYITGGANYGGGNDYYVTTIKYSNAGSATWTRTVNINSGTNCPVESGFAIAVDGSSNVWVAASLQETGGTYSDLVLLKYNSSGTLQTNYPKRFSSTACGGNGAAGLCLTISGSDVYVGGSQYIGSSTNWYFSVVKNDPSGSGWLWNYTYNSGVTGGTYEHRATDIKVNANGVYATGWINKTNSSVITKDIFTVGLNASTGAVIAGSSWPQTYNGTANGDDACNALSLDASGNVYVAGYSTRTGLGKDGYLMKYDKSGVAQTGFPVFYNFNDLADAWSDMEVIGTSTTAPAVYVGGYRTVSSTNRDYCLAAYTSAGGFANGASYWNTADPVSYDGAKTGTEAVGTDLGYAIEYSATSNRIYITGMADEGSSAHNINITTIGYNATTGASTWGPATYDMSTDATNNGTDEAFWKYSLKVQYSSCYATDIILVEGASWITNHGLDFVTIEYGATGACSQGPAHRIMNPSTSSIENSGFYPNPFSTTSELRLNPNAKITNATLTISDLTGRVVATLTNISSTSIMVDKGNLPNGVYFFKLVQDGVQLSNGKFVTID